MEGRRKIAEVRGVLQPETLMLHPLHPAVVHFPLVLSVLFPFVAAAALFASRRPGAGRGAWIGLTVMALLLVGSAWVAIETGEQQAEVVERVVPEGLVEGHEEAAEGLLLGAAILSAVILLGLVPSKVGRGARWLSVPAGLVVLGLAVRVGDLGGKLVYQHGAASVYVAEADTAAVTAPGPGERSEGREREGDDDRR